jgi:hypothetical protein
MINNLHEAEVIRNLNSEVKRHDIINYLIEKYNLVNYLEIGVFKGENIREIKAYHKDGVDPGAEGYVVPEVNYPMTSDDFFELIKDHDEIKYDIIFIDGLHHAEQVKKDIQNALNHIVKGGFIVLHDCNPVSYEAQLIPRETVAWNGDTWKAFVGFKMDNKDYKCCVVDTDFGVGIISRDIQSSPFDVPKFNTHSTLHWNQLNDDRKELLNLISPEEFYKLY